jgi:hypothetical protein
MSSAAYASTSRLAHSARIGSSRRDDAPLRNSGVAARHRRRATRVVAAVTEPGTVAAPLTKEDLVDYLRSGCKPKEQWRCVRGRRRSATHDVASGFSAPARSLLAGLSSREFSQFRDQPPFSTKADKNCPSFLVPRVARPSESRASERRALSTRSRRSRVSDPKPSLPCVNPDDVRAYDTTL